MIKISGRKFAQLSMQQISTYEKFFLPSEDNNTSDEVDVVQGWIDKMMQNGHWCDHVFLQLASNYLNKDFVILPINPEDCHNGTDRIVIK